MDFRNSTGISRRLRVLPCKSAAFSIKELRYDKELNSQRPELAGLDPLAAVVAPGMAAHLVVHFAPSTLNDESDCLTVCTETWANRVCTHMHACDEGCRDSSAFKSTKGAYAGPFVALWSPYTPLSTGQVSGDR